MNLRAFLLAPIALLLLGLPPALAQDFHVDLSMPSIWLSNPDVHVGTGHVEVTDAAGLPVGEGMVTLESSHPDAVQLSVVQVQLSPQGQGNFPIEKHFDQVTGCNNVTVTASYNGASASEALTVCGLNAGAIVVDGGNQAGVQSLKISPAAVVGGSPATAGINYNHGVLPVGFNGATVNMSSSHPSAASVPTTVNVQDGTADVQITTHLVASPQTVTITASSNSSDATDATLTVQPLGFKFLTLQPSNVQPGQGTLARLRLSAPAPKPLTVSLSADPASLVQLPPSISFSRGEIEKEFKVLTARQRVRLTRVTITATLPLPNGQETTAKAILEIQ